MTYLKRTIDNYKDLVLQLYPSCHIVKGYTRSAIYDTEKHQITLITNSVANALYNICGLTNKEIFSSGLSNEKEILHSIISKLLKKEIIFFSTQKEFHFLPTTQLDNNKSIESLILDFTSLFEYDIEQTLRKFSSNSPSVIQIRFFYRIQLNELNYILEAIHRHLDVKAIEIILPNEVLNDTKLANIIDENHNITHVILWGGSTYENSRYKQCVIERFTQSLDILNSCGFVAKELFICNHKFYHDALRFNTCLYKKCAIDSKGFLRNCPYMPHSYGHVDNLSEKELLNILESNKYQGIGFVKKDNIKDCCICEFRYACFDCRAFTQDNNLYSKPLKCNYNPYTGVWIEIK
ncbi:grasp-with-spasm system SPASM domain peptide maturase [Prevotella jejuni]